MPMDLFSFKNFAIAFKSCDEIRDFSIGSQQIDNGPDLEAWSLSSIIKCSILDNMIWEYLYENYWDSLNRMQLPLQQDC